MIAAVPAERWGVAWAWDRDMTENSSGPDETTGVNEDRTAPEEVPGRWRAGWTRLRQWIGRDGASQQQDGRTIREDPIARKPDATAHRRDQCMNCGTVLRGPYCHVCGQKDDDYRRPFMSLSNEFMSDNFQWDSRILRSLIPFVLMPGTLTRAFLQGRRGVYVTPLRLYVVISLIFFVTLAFSNVAVLKFEVHGVAAQIEQALSDAQDGDAQDGAGRNGDGQDGDGQSPPETPPVPEVPAVPEVPGETESGEEVGGVRLNIDFGNDGDGEDRSEDETQAPDQAGASEPEPAPSEPPQEPGTVIGGVTIKLDEIPSVRMFVRIDENERPNDQISGEVLEQLLENVEGDSSDVVLRLVQAVNLALREPRVFNQVLNTWLPRLMIFLVPLMAFLLAILYARKKRLKRPVYFVDHLVFSLHFHAFIFFLMLLLVLKAEYLGDLTNGEGSALFFFLAVCFYLFVGMKRIYEQGYIKTGFKFVMLLYFLFVLYATSIVGVMVWGVYDLVRIQG